jgi:hypothetical protein
MKLFFTFKLSNVISGRDAETKIRGRLKEKADQAKAKNEKEEKLRKELEEKFSKWNRGYVASLGCTSFDLG